MSCTPRITLDNHFVAWLQENTSYDLVKEFKESNQQEEVNTNCAAKRNAEFVSNLKQKIDQDERTTSYLAKEIGMRRLTIGLSIHKDLQYNSFVLKTHQLSTERNKIDRRVTAGTLLKDIKHDSASVGFLKFFSYKKNFLQDIQDRKVNSQNDRWVV